MSITVTEHLNRKIQHFTENAFSDIATLADWEAVRPERYRELMVNLGLHPLPSREGLRVREMGEGSAPGVRLRKVAYEIARDCWGSATFYYPAGLTEGKAPGVLYLCGHAQVASYNYQSHALMWARRGYVCLLVETLEQGDHFGEHHSYLVGRQEQWIAFGFTASGGEVWSAMRALDIFGADPLVDADRIGATGISGGGAQTFFIGMADERVRVIGSFCGLSTPLDAVVKHCHVGHCDCMYMGNRYGRELSEYAALIAPRPALFCNGDQDSLFTAEEVKAFVGRTQKVYDLYGSPENCICVTHDCGHVSDPVFIEEVQRLFDRVLVGEERPLLERGEIELTEPEVSVFHGEMPEFDHMALLPALLIPRGRVPLPRTPQEWPEIQVRAVAKVPYRASEPFEVHGSNAWEVGNWLTLTQRGTISGIEVRLHVQGGQQARRILVTLARGNEVLQETAVAAGGAQSDRMLAILEGRLSAGRFPEAPATERRQVIPGLHNRMLRMMTLAGESPILMMIADLDAALDQILADPRLAGREIYLHGVGDQAVAALYQGLRDERVAGVILADLPHSHADRAPIPGILRQFDLPEAIGLMAPRRVALINPAHSFWNWPRRAFNRLGAEANLVFASSTDHAFEQWKDEASGEG